MERYWIANLEWDEDFPVTFPDASAIALAVRRALREIEERIDGRVVLVAVPSARQIEWLLEWVKLEEVPPLHLIAPHERFSERAEDPVRVRELEEQAASVNVLPGRGTTEDHWKDCLLRARLVSEIRILLSGEIVGGANSRPCVSLHPETGAIGWHNFPTQGLLLDAVWRKAVTSVFGRAAAGSHTIGEFQEAASARARITAPRFRFLESSSLLLNLSPSFIFAIGAALAWLPATVNLWTFVAALLAAFAALGLSRVGWQKRWLSARAAAEIGKSLRFSRDFLDPLFPPAAIHLPAYATVARSLAIAAASVGKSPLEPVASARDRYIENRLSVQIAYYRQQWSIARRRRRLLKGLFYASTALAVLTNLAGLLYYLGALPGLGSETNDRWITGFAAWTFPALAAAAIGFLAIHESARRTTYYRELADEMDRHREILANLASECAITETVRDIENLLLEEVGEWLKRRMF